MSKENDKFMEDLLDAIAMVESGNNPKAINKKSGARGTYQFLPIAWEDVQNNYPAKYKDVDYESNVHNAEISRQFARDLLKLNTKRLKNKKKFNLSNLLASYNYGIGHVLKDDKFPVETKNYINKVTDLLSTK